jgi:hypothetical protein
MTYLYVKWNSSAVVCSPTVRSLKHAWVPPGHSWNEGLRRPGRRVQAVVEGVVIALAGVSQSEDCRGSPLDKRDERRILLLFIRRKDFYG